MLSLSSRLSIAATVVLASFLGLTGLTLDRAYRHTVESAVRDRLETEIYALLAASDLDERGIIQISESLPDSRLLTPGSGLYASITAHDHFQHWRSLSAEGIDIPFPTGLPRGASEFGRLMTADGGSVFALSFGLAWTVGGREQGYTFSVAEDWEAFRVQVAAFRRRLWGWLGGSAFLFLLVQGPLLHWSLRPLRQAARGLTDIEEGKATRLEGVYPKELRALTDNVNALLQTSQQQLQRSRHALADLAHSLKTPLAVLQADLEGAAVNTPWREDGLEQVRRLSQLVDYQLQRAATSGRTALMNPVPVATCVYRVCETLAKVYAEKGVTVHVDVPDGLLFHGDEADLLEVLGNILDNAFKWCVHSVEARVRALDEEGVRYSGIVLIIDDDGSGIEEQLVSTVRERGVRADTSTQGQGIGLAVVEDVLAAYGGKLRIGRSPLGGARVSAEFPGH